MRALEIDLEKHEAARSTGGRIGAEWISRVICAAPNASGRALAPAFHQALGSDRNMVSRVSIGNIRSAFVDMWKAMVFAAARDFIQDRLLELDAAMPRAAAAQPGGRGPATGGHGPATGGR